MQSTQDTTEYTVSIRIPFPEAISAALKQEKDRFVLEYGSSYKSEPHITLYLGRYTQEGFPKLLRDLEQLSIKSFSLKLLKPEVITEGLHRNLYVMDVSHKEQLQQLHNEILKIAVRYRSQFMRKKDKQRLDQGYYGRTERENLNRYGYARALASYEPHITLGEVDSNSPQPALDKIQENLKDIEGQEIIVSKIVVFFHGRAENEKYAKLVEEVTVPLQLL